MDLTLLKIGTGNAKLDGIANFELPAGHSCPFADTCLSKANKETGKITDGKNIEFRCFAASSENRFPAVRALRWHNFDLLKKAKTVEAMKQLIFNSIISNKKADKIQKVRIHSSGDFYNQSYFDAWLEVAKMFPNKLFYAYTKALKFWVARLGEIPNNVVLTASFGGRNDELIEQHNLRYVKVLMSPLEAEKLGLELDHDDSHAFTNDNKSFALLVHGTQPAGSEASKAKQLLRKQGIKGYSKNNKKEKLKIAA